MNLLPGISGDVEDLDAFCVAVATDHHQRLVHAQEAGAGAEVLARVRPPSPGIS